MHVFKTCVAYQFFVVVVGFFFAYQLLKNHCALWVSKNKPRDRHCDDIGVLSAQTFRELRKLRISSTRILQLRSEQGCLKVKIVHF